ncbi:L,D-transpeptidase, partial [Streptosporangium vulgare]|uniref:L,D-transpeptidase n=1 Tax=Streptosporangium vulgare TaxID=46190 RepID=UPI0031D1F6E0
MEGRQARAGLPHLDRQRRALLQEGPLRGRRHAHRGLPRLVPDARMDQRSRWGDQFYTIYFNGGIGFHGSERVPRHPASHGCIRVPLHNAKALYDMTPTGTPVYVRRPEAPSQPARATSPGGSGSGEVVPERSG